ncbi:barstar family protein [Nocardia sp. NBC_00511]|uniref:barstar family protein n=1 Tax=Nocardia sp. NBC_00511 TaxID=2903591 RepID=UPI002F914210
MAASPDPNPELGRRLLSNTSVHLYFRPQVLHQTVAKLRRAGYHVAEADASRWLCLPDMHADLSRMFHFPGYYGRNLDAFNDCLRDVRAHEYGFPTDATGLVMALTGYEEFAREFPDTAHAVLDIFAVHSRSAMLAGEQLIALVHTNDPRFTLAPVGATPVTWNAEEWHNARRGP